MAFESELLKRLRLGLSDDRKHLVIRSAMGRGEIVEYSFGLEEEDFLAHKRPLEVATNIHVDAGDAREELAFLRREVAKVADQFGFAIMACGTHPTAVWRESQGRPEPRYE